MLNVICFITLTYLVTGAANLNDMPMNREFLLNANYIVRMQRQSDNAATIVELVNPNDYRLVVETPSEILYKINNQCRQ